MERKNWLAFASGLALLPGVGMAQSGKGGDGVLEEVTVTAERREESLQIVPLAVTALTAEAIENRQVTEAKDLMRYTPSLKMFNNITSPTNLSPSMRGSLTQDASLVVAESPFGIYVDDVYIARLNGNNIALADIDRVEVLRGPQGTLYGRNTLVGAIKFLSRTPGDASWANVSVGAGNYEQKKISFSTGSPFKQQGWAGSFAGMYTDKGGQFFNRNPTVNDTTGREENYAIRGKLHYYSSERNEAVFSLSYSKARNDSTQLIPASTPGVPANRQFTSDDLVPQFGTYVVNTPNAARGPSPLKNLPEASTEQLIGSLNYTHDFGSIKLRSITGYVKTTDFFSTDFSGNGLVNGANNAAVKQWSEELQLLGSAAGEKLRYIAGIYLFSEEGTQRFGWNSYVPFPPFNIFSAVPVSSSDISMKTKSYSFFGQVDYLFTDNLKGSLGVRYTSDDKDFNMAFQSAFGGPPSLTPFSDTFSKTTPKASIDWQIASGGTIDSMLLYASAANAFKSGGYSAIAIFGNGDVAPYKPETNWTYELGMKTDMLGNRLRINANYFYSNVKDIVINQTLPGGRFPVNNAGDATIKGLEFELTAVPIEGLTLFLNGALLDGEYKNLNPFAAPALAPVNFDVQAVPPQIPDYSFAIGFDYKHAVASGGEFSFGADWYQTDDYITAATNDFRVKGYGLGNAFVGYGWNENWSARVTAKNLADNNIINTGSRGFLGGFIPVRPREIMLTINYKAK